MATGPGDDGTRVRIALIGSGEFEPWHAEVDRWLLGHGRGAGRVLVLPTAAAHEGPAVWERWASLGVAHYRGRLGLEAGVVPLRTREDAGRPEVVSMLDDAALVFFSGGNPARLVRVLEGTAFWAALLRRMRGGLAYAGCSAGAASLGMLAPDSEASRGGAGLVWETGLGLFPGTCVAPHWDGLERYRPGLTQAVIDAVPPAARLLGVDERTALAGDGREWRVTGAGAVHLLESGSWRHAFAGETLHLHLLDPAPSPAAPAREREAGVDRRPRGHSHHSDRA